MSTRSLLAFVLLFAASSRGAFGHNISVSRGGLAISPNAIQAHIFVSLSDILHRCELTVEEFAKLSPAEIKMQARKCGLQIGQEIIIRDADGVRIGVPQLLATSDNLHAFPMTESKNVTAIQFHYDFLYPVAVPISYLTLQQTFFSDRAPHQSQLSLGVQAGPFDTGGTHVLLTNRGNTATVAIDWPPAGSKAAPRITTPVCFSSVLAQMWIEDREIVLQIDVPLPLLETWMTLKRQEPDFIDAGESAAILQGLRELVSGENQMKVDGKAITPRVAASGMMNADDKELIESKATAVRYGYYITRSSVRLCYPLASPPKKVEFEWSLFNNAILDAEFRLHANGKTTERTLLKFAPTLTWERP